jgi:potassium-transporting ATPase KdpC subunit
MLKQLRTALILLGVFTVITGIIYPLFVTGLAQSFFNYQANGSMIEENGTVRGSELIGQPFSDPEYFWGRLSATVPFPGNAAASSGSNYGTSNQALLEVVQARIDALKAVDRDNNAPVPVDLVTSSGSGLDPHISVAAAEYQSARVARYRGLSKEQVRELVNKHTEGRMFGILGEPRINVLKLNLALDAVK